MIVTRSPSGVARATDYPQPMLFLPIFSILAEQVNDNHVLYVILCYNEFESSILRATVGISEIGPWQGGLK